MRPEVVKANLIRKKIKMREIAAEAGCSPTAVTLVIQRKSVSKRIREIIADKIKYDYERVWGACA
jgi:lambda repressor-like predicted transcriptional regulator